MPRYVDAEKIRPFKGLFEADFNVPKFYDWLETIPTADVRLDVHAHWIHERLVSTSGGSYPIIRCSSCHWPYPMSETRFCPNCGARMDERRE